MMKKLMGCALVTMVSSSAFAGQTVYFKIHEEYLSPRALGMGGAFAAVAEGHDTLFYNPAGLARRKDGRMNLYLPQLGLGGNIMQLLSDLNDASSKPEAERQTALATFISGLYGSNYMGRLNPLGGFWVRPNWGIAFIPMDLEIDIFVRQQIGPQLNIVTHGDTTLAFGLAKDFKWFGPHHFSAGVTTKVINRVQFAKGLNAVELSSNSDVLRPSDMAEGLTMDFDIGTLFTPELPQDGILSWLHYAKPTFALVVRNVLDYGYLTNLNLIGDESSTPTNLQRRIDIGTAWEYPRFWKVFKPRGVMDFRNIGHRNWSFLKGFHIGAELDWRVGDWLNGGYRFGFNQGYFTAGVSAKAMWFNLDLATYGEEVGTSQVRKENRNFMLKMSMDF